MDIETRLTAIEQRNTRVTAEKAWETSWLRRGLIAGITYVCGIILLTLVGHEDAWKHAFVPVMGYTLSTFSLPPIRKLWIERRMKGKGSNHG